MSQYATNYYKISQDITKYHKISQNITEYHKISQYATKYYKISQDITRCHKISQDITRCHKISQNITKCYKPLQKLQFDTKRCITAHHNSNHSNAIAPLVSLWLLATTGVVMVDQTTPILILLYGGIGMSLGLIVLGSKVIKTVGEDLAKVTPSRWPFSSPSFFLFSSLPFLLSPPSNLLPPPTTLSGFCIELGTALTVLVASNVGMPVSTTHCKVTFLHRFHLSPLLPFPCPTAFVSRETTNHYLIRNDQQFVIEKHNSLIAFLSPIS